MQKLSVLAETDVREMKQYTEEIKHRDYWSPACFTMEWLDNDMSVLHWCQCIFSLIMYHVIARYKNLLMSGIYVHAVKVINRVTFCCI